MPSDVNFVICISITRSTTNVIFSCHASSSSRLPHPIFLMSSSLCRLPHVVFLMSSSSFRLLYVFFPMSSSLCRLPHVVSRHHLPTSSFDEHLSAKVPISIMIPGVDVVWRRRKKTMMAETFMNANKPRYRFIRLRESYRFIRRKG